MRDASYMGIVGCIFEMFVDLLLSFKLLFTVVQKCVKVITQLYVFTKLTL